MLPTISLRKVAMSSRWLQIPLALNNPNLRDRGSTLFLIHLYIVGEVSKGLRNLGIRVV